MTEWIDGQKVEPTEKRLYVFRYPNTGRCFHVGQCTDAGTPSFRSLLDGRTYASRFYMEVPSVPAHASNPAIVE